MDICQKSDVSLLFNMLSRFVIVFLPSSKCLNFMAILTIRIDFISFLIWKDMKSDTISTFSPPIFPSMKLWDWKSWSSFLECWVLSQLFHSPLLPSSRGSLVSLQFLPFKWCHLPICCGWYFSQQSWFQLVSHSAWHFRWYILHSSEISRVKIYSLDVLLSQF